MAVNINANPGKITELAAIIKDSYLAIDNETSTLNSRLKSFANTLDNETYCLIKNKVEALLVKISESEDSVKQFMRILCSTPKRLKYLREN